MKKIIMVSLLLVACSDGVEELGPTDINIYASDNGGYELVINNYMNMSHTKKVCFISPYTKVSKIKAVTGSEQEVDVSDESFLNIYIDDGKRSSYKKIKRTLIDYDKQGVTCFDPRKEKIKAKHENGRYFVMDSESHK